MYLIIYFVIMLTVFSDSNYSISCGPKCPKMGEASDLDDIIGKPLQHVLFLRSTEYISHRTVGYQNEGVRETLYTKKLIAINMVLQPSPHGDEPNILQVTGG